MERKKRFMGSFKNHIRKTVYLLLSFFIFSCKNEKNLDNKLYNFQEKCLAQIEKEIDSKDYLVSPRLNDFKFNRMSDDIEDIYHVIPKEIIENKSLDFNLIDLSKKSESRTLISFSKIVNDKVFVEIIQFCDSMKKTDLKSNYFNDENKIKNITWLEFTSDKKGVKTKVICGVVYEIYDIHCQ